MKVSEMFRLIFELLITVVVLTVLKSIVGIVLRGFSQAMKPDSSPLGAGPQSPNSQSSHQVPLTGELKKDPVCGTYIATTTSIKERVGGEVIHFCSTACRDKYVATLAR
jgi:YHS domain-containing protein